MNKLIITTSLFTLFFLNQLKAYMPICFKGHFYVYEWNAGLGQYEKTYATVQCDTIINSLLYYKVLYCDINGNNTSYIGAMREDSISQKVFYIDKDSLQERLVFDFSLQVNDTFNYSYSTWTATLQVDSVKTEFLYGQNRKVIYFDSLSPIIEGVGSQRWGLFDRPLASSGFFATNKLINTYAVSDPCYPASIVQTDKQDISLSVYPNPVQSELHIALPSLSSSQVYFQVVNIFGQIVSKGVLNNSNVLHVDTYQKGMYVLHLRVNNWDNQCRFYKE